MPFDAARYPLGFKSLVEPMDKDLVSVSLASDSSDASGPTIFHITLLAAQTPDNRLTPQFLTALLAALEHVESQWDDVLSGDAERGSKQGAALVLSSVTQGPSSKFFSNGLDFESAIRDPTFFDRFLFPVYDKLLTFPIPTVASLGGHAFAAGFGLSCACDYAVMGKKGYMCMNEIDFGAQIPPGLFAPLSTRLSLPVLRRRMTLEGERFSGSEALRCGLIDEHHTEADPVQTLQKAVEVGKKWAGKAKAGVWGENKKIIHAEQLQVLRTPYALTLSRL